MPYGAWLETVVTGPTAVTFWWRTFTATNQSVLTFYINASRQGGISGKTGWERHSFFVPEGTQTLRWQYVQNALSGNQVWLDEVSLEPPQEPVVTFAQNDLVVDAAETVTLAPTVAGTEPLTMRWYFNGVPMSAATNAVLTIANAQAPHAGSYALVVTNPLTVVTSGVVTVTITPRAPLFTIQPDSQTNILGSSVSFSSSAKGTEPIFWQWYHDALPVKDATNRTLTLPNLQESDAGNYTVSAWNDAGETSSQPATLTVALKPIITLQPFSQGVAPGASVTFAAAALGSGLIAWQWYSNGGEIAGATTSCLTLTNVQASILGDYWGIIQNSYGSVTTAVARLGFSPVVAWGRTNAGTTQVPFAITNVVALAGGDHHALALRRDGTIGTWGADWFGLAQGVTNIPPDATNLVGVAAGSFHGLGLKDDGTIIHWGGIMGGGDTPPPNATSIVALALGPGAHHALGLRADGSVVDWGGGRPSLADVPPEATNIIAVAAGAYHADCLRADGTVVSWGVDVNGSGYWTTNRASNAVDVATGWYHTLALRPDRTLLQWFAKWAPTLVGTPAVPQAARDVDSIACGGYLSLALQRNGKVIAWGPADYGQTNVPYWVSNITAVAATSYGGLALIGEGPPEFVMHPLSLAATAGDNHRFVAKAVGTEPLGYQWLMDGIPLPNQNARWLIITNIQPTDGHFAVVASNDLGAVTSRVATVMVAPSGVQRIEVPKVAIAISNTVASIRGLAFGLQPMSYQWQLNGTNLADSVRIQGATTATLSISGVIPEDLGGYTLAASNSYSALTSSIVTLRYASAAETLSEGIDLPGARCTLESPGWIWQTNTTHDGFDAVQSDNRDRHSTTAGFNTTNSGPIAIFFWWKVSSQTNSDSLRFSIDNTEMARISGEVDWQQRSFLIPAVPLGVRYPTWRYVKNGSVSAGADSGWVDEVSFGPPVAPQVSISPSAAVIPAGSSLMLIAQLSGTEPFYRSWRLNEADLPGQTNSVFFINSAQPSDSGYYTLTVTNVAGTVSSSAVTVAVLPAGTTTHPWFVSLSATEMQICWSAGTLESATDVSGPWVEHGDAISPLTVQTTDSSRFFRVRMTHPPIW